MKKSDLLDMAIKLFGVNVFINAIVASKDLVVLLMLQLNISNHGHVNGTMFLAYFANPLLLFLIAWFLMFRSSIITRRLMQSTEDSVSNFQMDKSLGIEIACIVIGGLVITSAVSSLGFYVIQLVEAAQANFEPPSKGFANIVWQIILIVLGYVLISMNKVIANHFMRKNDA